jgi:lysine decarboxylase
VPASAFLRASETVETSQAVGRVTVELVAPYAPGIPILAYAADPTLATHRVVR